MQQETRTVRGAAKTSFSVMASAPPEIIDRFLRIDEVHSITGLSKSTVYRYCSAGTFPRPIPLGGNRVAWLLSEIERWMNDRLAARSSPDKPTQ